MLLCHIGQWEAPSECSAAVQDSGKTPGPSSSTQSLLPQWKRGLFCPSVAFYKLKSRVQVTAMVSVSITLVMSRLHLSHKQYYSVLMHHVEKEGCEQVEFFIAVFSFSTHLWFWFLYKENDLLEPAFLVLHSFGVCVTLSRRRAFVSNIKKNCKTQSWVRLSEISAPVMSWCCPPEGSIVSSHLLLISG